MTGNDPQLEVRALFGGAMVASIPEIFVDASDFRPVPSSQEVFVSSASTSDLSIIIDILQYVEPANPPPSSTQIDIDMAACKIHFEDIIDGREGTLGYLFSVEPLPGRAEKMGINTPVYLAMGTVSSPQQAPGTKVQKELGFTLLLMAVFRLKEVRTDVLVTVNCPVDGHPAGETRVWHPGGNGKSVAVDNAVTLLKEVVESLEVKDWGLFSPED
ncbi:hypothetical protein BDZ91DRAFT_743385 [Kalaharituber pfeilii]|nr:hypothetical protein BDZ91DRAFT_743385 [Kalaharituber pfeilii]